MQRDEVAVQLTCGAVVVVRVRIARGRCGRDDCDHPTTDEAVDMIRLAVLEAQLKEKP